MKKLLSSILCSAMLMGTLCVPAFATDLKSFSDVPADKWSHDAIMEMVDLGMFKGTKDPDENGVGEFSPKGTMTKAQFLVVATRHLFNDELNSMEQGENWYANNYDVAVSEGMITKYEFPYTELNTPITREQMALIAVRTAELQGEKMPELVKPSRIADYNTIGSYYKDFVVKAISMGLISGYDDKGTFGPTDTLTREQGAMVAYRLVKEEVRVYPSTKPSLPEIIFPEAPEINDGPMTIYEGQQTMRPAKAGDIFVKADGTKVTLKIGPNGILGEGQGVAPDAHLKGQSAWWTGNRINFSVDKEGNWVDSTGWTLQNARYYINPYTGEGHWESEYNVLKKAYPKPTTDGSYYKELSSDSMWYWDDMFMSWRTCYLDDWAE